MTEDTVNSGIRVNFHIDDAFSTSDIKIQPKTVWVTEFNEEAAKEFAENMHRAHLTGQTVIPVIIDSYGGEVYSLLSMIAEIRSSELPVATIVKGKAMSCGSFLAAAGTPGYRYCDSEATYMIHEVSSMAWGKTEEVKADAAETARLNNRVFKILDQHCDQELGYFLEMVHQKKHADWYLSAAAAKKQRIVDHIKIPTMEIKLSANWKLL